jgi:transposase
MKTRKEAFPVFKTYVMNQAALLPASYEEMIPEKHLVRIVNEAVEKIDVSALLGQYKGGGTSSYHPKMMLKVLVYAYSEKIYSSRKIAKALRENIQFMWISGQSTPDFRTINDFRGSRMKEVIEEVFTAVLEYMIQAGHVKMEHYFVDGTKIEADGNKHKVVWSKRKENYQKRVREQIKDLLKQIEQENKAEQDEYGEDDLEEMGGNSQEDINSEKLKQTIDELNKRLRERAQKKKDTKPAQKILKKLSDDCLPRLEKYEKQGEVLAGRNSYSKTDPDAVCMRMKEDRGNEKPWPKPAYNIQIGTEGQFIVGFSVHNQAGDTSCLIPHLEGVRKGLGRLPEKIVSDAGYGSEENYDYLEQKGAGNYLKYNTFYQDTHHYRDVDIIRQHQFRAENFGYNTEKDEFICPAKQRLHFSHISHHKTDNGYEADRRHYECDHCKDCPLRSQCTKAKGNRSIAISFKLLAFRKQARENLTSEEGKRLRAQRSVEVETVFGNVKHNMGFRRFHLRGLQKVKTEWGLVSIAHNMKKLAAI